MTDQEDLYVRSNGHEETQECALVWRGLPSTAPRSFPISRFSWSEAGKAFIDRIHRLAKATGTREGRELPYSDLRATLQARIPGMLLLQSRLLRVREDSPLFVAGGRADDVLKDANRAVAAWCQLTLLPWAEKLAIDCRDVVSMETRARAGDVFVEMPGSDVASDDDEIDALTSDFHDIADPMLAVAASRLDGIELFPGLGPVYRVVDGDYGNSISFETWPTAGPRGDDLFSMVATVSVETRPSSRLPYLVVRSAKRVWCREFPAAGQLYGRRRITVRVARRGDDGVPRGVALSVALAGGEPASHVDALMFEASRSSGETLNGELIPLTKNRGAGPSLFVGIPFRYGYHPVPKIEAGATFQDQMDLMRVVGRRLDGFGFSPSRLRLVEVAHPRPTEFHVQATLHNLITHHFGRMVEDEVPARVEELFGAPERKTRGPEKPVKTVDLRPMVEANRQRLDKAFGSASAIDLVFLCRRESEARIFQAVVALLFGDRVQVVRYGLPEGVHGTQKSLDGGTRRTRAQRAGIRRQAWMEFAEELKRQHPNSPVIVQAAREYDGVEEDTVNKDVGRNTLATVARCSVQYLLPPGSGKAAEYMHRVQAALYDLLFAHSGLGPVPADVVAATFPGSTAPRTILGISIVSQAASRKGRPEGAELVVALRTDVATGKVAGRFGAASGQSFDTGQFRTLSETLVRVASAGSTSLGEKVDERRRNFIAFVRTVVDEIAEEDPNALVIFDSTNARTHWRWLADESIGRNVFLEERSAPAPKSWGNLRLVRVRERAAGRVGVLKARSWRPVDRSGEERDAPAVEEVYATAIERLVECLPEGKARAKHFLAAHGFGIRNRGARGQSTYRSKEGFERAGAKTTPKRSSKTPKVLFRRGINAAWDKPSRLPVPIEITVLPSSAGDDEDAIAALVSSLRNGYSHTADGTFLPAPLSFRSKITDYMDRYGTRSDPNPAEPPEEEVSDTPDDVEAESPPEEPSIGYGDIRRWFEGASDFEDADIPGFESEDDSNGAGARQTTVEEPWPIAHRDDLPASPIQTENVIETPTESSEMPFTTTVQHLKNQSTPILDLRPPPQDDQDSTERLLAAVQSPSAKLPEGVDASFLAGIVHFVNADLRRMHDDRAWIRAVTGFPWPEQKPSVEEMPALYADALRYPAFAIVVQRQFFTEDTLYRGLPKNQSRRQFGDLLKRARREKPLARHERHLHVLEALKVREIGGELDLVVGELLGAPGHVAWDAQCPALLDGLDQLDINKELAPTARYLRDVLSPFVQFGESTTVGDIFQSTIIPRSLQRPVVQVLSVDDAPPSETGGIAGVRESEGGADVSAGAAAASTSPSDSETHDAVALRWRAVWAQIAELGAEAGIDAPSAGPLDELRIHLADLEKIRSTFDRLVPVLVATDAVRDVLRAAIAVISEGLNELHGESFDAPALLATLFELDDAADPAAVQAAIDVCGRAKERLTESATLATGIAHIEATMPKKKARDETGPLIDRRDLLLREALDLAGAAVALLPKRSQDAAPAPDLVPVENETAAAAGGAVPAEAVGMPVEAIDEAGVAESQIDATMADIAEPYDPNATFDKIVLRLERRSAAEDVAADPLRDDVVARLDRLFALGEYGLAYHLHIAASEILRNDELPYTSAEFRLASAAGRTIALGGQDHFSLAAQRGEAISVAQRLGDFDDDRSLARLNLLLAGSVAAALFRADDVNAVTLVETIGGKGPFASYFKLGQVIDENRKRGYPLTPANVLAIEAHSRDDSYVAGAVIKIKDTIEAFRQSRFRFTLGERIKHALTQPQGLLGRLTSELTATETAAARSVAEELNGREKIVAFLERATSEIGTGQEIDGAARERLLSLLSDVSVQCGDLVQTVDGFVSLRQTGGRLDAIRRLRDLALAGIEDVLADAEVGGTLFGASKIQSTTILKKLGDVLRGGIVDRDVMPLAVGLHAPLLWLPKLTWTGSWQPSPYDPDRILQEIMALDVPLLKDPERSIRDAFEARRKESAFVPAYMLLNVSSWLGFNKEEAEQLRSRLDADKEIKKNQVSERLEAARRLVDRMRRMAVGSLDQSSRLAETLSTINPKKLPVELPSSFLPETLEGDRVEDFNSAVARIESVEAEAQRAFDAVTADYAAQIDELKTSNTLDPGTESELRNLLEKCEFTTLADWLNMLRTGGVLKPRLPSGVINTRLAWYRSILPDLGTLEPLQAARAVDSGATIGPLDYGGLDADRREEGARILRIFPELKRLVKDTKGANVVQIRNKTTELASALLYDVVNCKDDETLTRSRQPIYVFDARIILPPADSTTLVLPEFGSTTQGTWRICVVTPTTPPLGLVELASMAGSRGVVVLYLGVLGREKREQLRVELNKRKRAMLVIDEALAAATIADPEDRRRSVIEIAQGYSGADPYKDHGKSAVPPEMFKGRTWERGEITSPAGSYIVYGGRRLGKTALLQQIHSLQPAHAIFAYVDLDVVGESSDAFEQISRKIGTEVFRTPARSGDDFSSAIVAWLDGDERRRMLLLLDEADRFVKSESQSDFICIQTMLRLMADTKHRFKFVLAGLHNVSRIVRAENSPLVQISSNPLQIGPLLNRDVDDAEFLVRGPLAAMGYEFDRREDVWRILSFTNYYPVLIQVFCKELLGLIHEQIQQTSRIPNSISTALVERALNSSDVKSKLFASFERTIASIESRYELITYILAVREVVERDSGMDAEGMSAAEVADRAMECWPAAFPRGSDALDFEYLLEEMEGFGIARKTVSGRFALRSRSLLELMESASSESDLSRRLDAFRKMDPPPNIFDPKNVRARLGSPLPRVDSEGRISPLTDGQEADLLAPAQTLKSKGGKSEPATETHVGIGVVFGADVAGIRYVAAALLDSKRARDKLIDVELKTFETKKDMLDEARKPPRGDKPKVIVVSTATAWRPDWVVEAERIGRIRKGEVRLIFVGQASHARAWAGDPTVLKRVLPQIKVVKLRPWSRSYLGSRLESLQLSIDLIDRIRQATGNWSDTVSPLMDRIAERPSEAKALVAEEGLRLRQTATLDQLGIPDDLVGFYREIAAYSDGSTITSSDFQYLCTADGRNMSPRVVSAYSDLLGILSFPPTSVLGQRRVDLNPLAHAILLGQSGGSNGTA
jgi:hypothetical protein